MRKRGRPPYPDVLTPREWEALELRRAGRHAAVVVTPMGASPFGPLRMRHLCRIPTSRRPSKGVDGGNATNQPGENIVRGGGSTLEVALMDEPQ